MERRRQTATALMLVGAVLGGCGEPGRGDAAGSSETGAAARGAVVEVWFSRGEEPVAVERRVAVADPEAALSALVAGPRAEERAAGIGSWFSDSTARSLAGTELRDGFLVVDFRGLARVIPGAGSSAGSSQLLTSLDSTVFQFPVVDSVEYRLDGSCAAFWEWLQRGCMVVSRP
jgi:Sporulation and spore germination